jgi:FKBP-type peptidyl-prolyl cis-trans isomerase
MKNIVWVSFIIIVLLVSCRNNKNKNAEQNSNKEVNDPIVSNNSFSYKYDSTSDDVAVLLITHDGKSEYVIGNPEKIFQKTKSGLEYRYIISNRNKKQAKIGDIVHIDMEYRTDNDSVIFNSKSVDNDFKMHLLPPSHLGGSIEEAFLMMMEGDSAIFRIDAVNFLTKTQKKINIPEYVKDGDKFTFYIKMNKIVEDKDFIKEISDTYKHYIEQEKSLIERFAIGMDFDRSVTKSGLNIFSINKGNGSKAKSGNTVTIDYTASFIDGTVFDSTIERNEPFEFIIGSKEVIEGLEEGVEIMNVGDHNIFVIPFRLAYGSNKHGIIPPFSTLIFEVKLRNVE